MGTSDPTVYTGVAPGQTPGGNLYNYPFTGSNPALYQQMMIYTGNLAPTPGAGGPAGQFPGALTWTRPGTPGHYESHPNQQESFLGGLDIFGVGHSNDTWVPGQQQRQVSAGPHDARGVVPAGTGPKYEQVSLDQFVASYANLTGDQMKALQAKLVAAGAMSPTGFVKGLYDDSTRQAVFKVALAVSSRNDPLFTFDTALNQAIKYNAQQNTTKTTTAFDVSTPDQAKGFLLSQMQQMLGRDPTDAEYAAFVGQLNAYEKAHPTVTTTVSGSTIDPTTGGAQVKSQTQTGGVTDAVRQNQALQAARGAPDYHAVQALNFLGALDDLAHATNDAGTSTAGV